MKTFENQSKLPRLIVPELESTLTTYSRSVQPFLNGDEATILEGQVADFMGGLGPILQARLQAYDGSQRESWLEDWWLKLAYLSWREALMIHSNWYILTAPLPRPSELEGGNIVGFTEYQLTRAAGFVSNMLNYKSLLDSEQIPAESTKSGPLCMNQYKWMFGITRVPKPECDVLVGSFPSPHKHIVVLVRDQIYVMPVFDTKGSRLSIASLVLTFKRIVNEVTTLKSQELPIGLLSSGHRDTWATQHAHLLKLGNQNSFHWIETALFAVSLDDKPVDPTLEGFGKTVFHNFDGHNRWFDKSLTIVVTNDGRLGLNGEHSPCDALVPALLVDYARQNEPAKDPVGAVTAQVPVKKITWKTDSTILGYLKEAQVFADGLIKDSDVRILHFKGYGSDFIKKYAKVSPDAYVQMCLQATFHRIHHEFTAVYETSSTRKYNHGRTETCRSFSTEQKEFVLSLESSQSAIEKFELLKKACSAHVAYIAMASDGRGCDRHLLGLRLVMKPGESHALFSSPVFAKSQKWRLSTSALFAGDRMLATGFGTVYPDGYGMNYMIGSGMIKMGVESKVSCKETSSTVFIDTFSKVLEDVGAICKAVHPDSKL